jgi:hypothetical protein
VTEIELVPSKVAIASDPFQPTTFVLEARLWSGPANDRETIVEGICKPLTWSVSPPGLGLQFSSAPSGHFATLVLAKGAAPVVPIEVRVEVGGMTATTQVVRPATGDDPVAAAYAPGQAPDAIVVRGKRTLTDPCEVWVAPGLVRTGIAGSVADVCGGTDPPWGVTVLDQGNGMPMYPVPWNSSVNPSNPGAMPLMRVVPVAIRVFISGADLGIRQTHATQFGQDEIDYANLVFRENRVGIKLVVMDQATVPQPSLPHIETDIPDCATGDKVTVAYDHTPMSEAMLHVYLVDGASSADGFTCAPNKDRPYPVIYLAVGRSGTILLHEVGHALGLDLPGAGHTDEIAGFDPADVMAGGYADTDNIWRRRLTVGQAFRINAEAGSWLNWARKPISGTLIREIGAPRLACQCGQDDPAGNCPRLSDDLARKRGGLGRLESWQCGDQIWMDPIVEAAADPRALVAGREWRTGTGECPSFVPGYPLAHDSRLWIKLHNLTRTGSCKSWVAIFFEGHRPAFRRDEKMDGGWSDASDVRYARDVLEPPRAVNVHVWFDPSDIWVIPAAEATSEDIFGKHNRGGLTFKWSESTTLPSTCPPDDPGPPIEYQVCYSSTTGPTLPQLLGEKWGLHLLAGLELGNPVYTDNAMDLLVPGTKLTLGQLFRVHATLPPDLPVPEHNFPDCGAEPCPPLDADAGP